MSQNECVKPKKIEELLSGSKLTAEEARVVGNHITECDICRELRDIIVRHAKATIPKPHRRRHGHH